MNASKTKKMLKEQYPKSNVLLFALDSLSNLKSEATVTPKKLLRHTYPILKSVSDVMNQIHLLKKLGIIKVTNKHTTKAMIKYTFKLNPKFQSKQIFNNKVNREAKQQLDISKKL